MSQPPDPNAPLNVTMAQLVELVKAITSGDGSAAAASTKDLEAVPAFVPAGAAATPTSESILRAFSFIPRGTILEIIKHTFHPFLLHKLDLSAAAYKSTSGRKVVNYIDGQLTIDEKDPSVKEYPNLQSLLIPISIYFDVLATHAASSGKATAVLALHMGASGYSRQLTQFSRTHQWPAILAYHTAFFLARQAEMLEGNYSNWSKHDDDLKGQHLWSHVRPVITAPLSAKSQGKQPLSATSAAAQASQVCFNFNRGSCAGGASCKRIHKCSKCDASTHGLSTCPKTEA